MKKKVEWYDVNDLKFTPNYVAETVEVSSQNPPRETDFISAASAELACYDDPTETMAVTVKIIGLSDLTSFSETLMSISFAAGGAMACAGVCSVLAGSVGSVIGGAAQQFGISAGTDSDMIYAGVPSHYRVTMLGVPPNAIGDPIEGDGVDPYHGSDIDLQAFRETKNAVYKATAPYKVIANVSPQGCATYCRTDSNACKSFSYYYTPMKGYRGNLLPFSCELYDLQAAENCGPFKARPEAAEVVGYFELGTLPIMNPPPSCGVPDAGRVGE